MGVKSNIEWTDATWNPLRGCSRVSQGCVNCYAEAIAARFSGVGQPFEGLAHFAEYPNGTREARWTGKVALASEKVLLAPLHWRKPRRIFVNSMSDLFHENVPDEWIDKIFAVMALAPHHTFQVLTKRPERMREYMKGIPSKIPFLGRMPLERIHLEAAGHMEGDGGYMDTLKEAGNVYSLYLDTPWPLPNVWLGTSIENADVVDRIEHLRQVPAAIRFISFEPLIGAVGTVDLRDIHWVIVGGESGPNARAMHPDWVRSLRDRCAAAEVPFFFKQWGAWLPTSGVDCYCHGPSRKRAHPDSDGIAWLADGRIAYRDFSVAEHRRRIKAGVAHSTRAVEVDHEAIKDFCQSIDDEKRVLDNPLGLQWMYRVGKKAAGAMLDGREHREFPA